jgi:superfamily I DNA and/or RNA helicase
MAGKEIYSSRDALKKARDQIKKCRSVFTTCIGAGLGLLRDEAFDTVIIDEASQQTEPASLVPLTKGCRKAILVGDHVQLGATVQRHAVALQYDVSLFERLYTRHTSPGSNSICRIMLDTQYRMHRSICEFSSAEFYENKLCTGVPDNARPLAASQFPWPTSTITGNGMARGNYVNRMVFVQCSSPEEFGGKSKANQGQADLCSEICKMLCTAAPAPPVEKTSKPAGGSRGVGGHRQQIAVLTPYSRQAELLEKLLAHLPNVEVSSIDGFQGREADVVIFVTVRCNVKYEIGFLKELRRMNVVLTRAKAAVIVIGDRATLTKGIADPESRLVWERLLGRLAVVELDGENKKV